MTLLLRWWALWPRDESGASLIELALLTPLLLLMLVGSVDLGRGFYAANEVAGAASAGAAYGVQNFSDADGMQRAALLDAADLNGMTAAVTYGCECADGSSVTVGCSSTPSCTNHAVHYVEVRTEFTYTPALGFPGLPSSYALHGFSRMRAND